MKGLKMHRFMPIIAVVLLLSGCVSYYEGYEQDYFVSSYGGYYQSPLRLQGLSYNDFYMLDNYPRDYFNTQIWSAVSNISRFGIVSFFEALR